jgi:hypothetical protein
VRLKRDPAMKTPQIKALAKILAGAWRKRKAPHSIAYWPGTSRLLVLKRGRKPRAGELRPAHAESREDCAFAFKKSAVFERLGTR